MSNQNDVIYSSIRDHVLKGLESPAPIPAVFSGEVQELVNNLQLNNLLYIRVLPFADSIYIDKKLEELFKDNKIDFLLGRDTELIYWLITRGVCGPDGKPIFSEDDIKALSGKYAALIYSLCWAVLGSNGMVVSAKQALVKNSEGTE